ncbi:hypothetical protein BGZ63DRAFT_403664 [Mariannaea sp. PMI_226]|nr:hypothetical protein BGZ63DRAFT_403664 [Mariannaea sp. PMI_226]
MAKKQKHTLGIRETKQQQPWGILRATVRAILHTLLFTERPASRSTSQPASQPARQTYRHTDKEIDRQAGRREGDFSLACGRVKEQGAPQPLVPVPALSLPLPRFIPLSTSPHGFAKPRAWGRQRGDLTSYIASAKCQLPTAKPTMLLIGMGRSNPLWRDLFVLSPSYFVSGLQYEVRAC